jgi:hypothetical protein
VGSILRGLLAGTIVVGCSSSYESAQGTPDAGPSSSSSGGIVSKPADAGPTCNVSSDVMNCGACGHVCPERANGIPSCSAGACGVACNQKTGNCDKDDTNGCETSLGDDPKNCGACGHDCEGGACTDGVCQPFALVGGEGTCNQIRLTATDVFWTALGKGVDGCPKTGCGGIGASFLPLSTDGFGIGGSSVYAENSGTGDLFSCTIAGCAGQPTLLGSGLGDVHSIATDATAIYLANGGSVLACPLAGCPSGATPLASSQSNADNLVVAAGFLYWSEAFSPGRIWRYPIGPASQPAQKLLDNVSGPTNLVVDDTKIFFNQSSDGAGTVYYIPIAGAAAATTLTTVSTFIRALAGDATSVFVGLDGSILQIDKATGAKKTLATGSFFTRGIAVDDKAVYITTRSGITKVIRP